MEEVWLAVEGYEGLYEVSTFGRVRSLPRRVPCKHYSRITPALVLKPVDIVGYSRVVLYKEQVASRRLIHRLVAAAFIRPGLPGEQVNHIDADPANNRVGNLEWVTPQGNSDHAKKNNLLRPPLGAAHYASVLTDADVAAIRDEARKGADQKSLALAFGVHQSTISLILSRKRWAHI